MESHRGLPVVAFASQREWERWLDASHASAHTGVWLKVAKKGSGIASITHPEAIEIALCYGWIDGQRLGHDETWFLQKFTPRRPRSRWSRINRDAATALIGQGRMRPAGLAQVEAAKADGRWDAAYEGQGSATVPEDLQAALDASPKAAAFFATLGSQNRYAILYRVQDAKRPETRARRIASFVAMLEEGKTIHPT